MSEKSKKRSKYSNKYKKRPDEKESKEFSKLKESANDPSWYYYSEQSLKDAGRFSFNNALGVALSIGTADLVVPGIMNIYTTPSIGYSTSATSAVNLAAKNIYSYVRHANSGHTNYDSPDLMMYILAIDSCYAMYSWMTRIYGLAKIYIQQNRYWGAKMLQSMGLDADDFARNLAQFRTFINQYAIKLSAFYVPASMSLFKRHIWMYSNVYADENDPKASVYMYQPAYLFQYDEVNAKLKPYGITCAFSASSGIGQNIPNTKQMANVMNDADNLLNAIVASEDMNIMSGDILKAYGAENCWKFAAIPDDYSVIPIFSEEVLLQIHNTKFAGNYPVAAAGDKDCSLSTLEVWQSTSPGNGYIGFAPVFKRMGVLDLEQVFDSWKREVSPEDVLVGSRNMLAANTTIVQDSSAKYYPYALLSAIGTEICLFAVIWRVDRWGNFTGSTHYLSSNYHNTITAALDYVTEESRFNQCPLTTKYVDIDSTTGIRTVIPNHLAGQLSNYTTMVAADILKLHDTALLTEFAVPFLGNAVKK